MPVFRLGKNPASQKTILVRLPFGSRQRWQSFAPILVFNRPIRLLILLLVAVPAGCRRTDEADSALDTYGHASADSKLLDRSIRVLLADQAGDCQFFVEGLFDLMDVDGEKLLAEAVSLPELSVLFEIDAIHFRQLPSVYQARVIDLIPRSAEHVGVRLSDGDQHRPQRRFRGRLRLVHNADGSGSIINILDIEDYLVGVVSAELYAGFHPEAFRAQAIAARTYAWYEKRTGGPFRDWDVKANESSQVYLGLEREKVVPKAARAVQDTRGLVCTWASPLGERIFCTYYSSTCGGSTQAAGPVKNEPIIPPLVGGIQCDYCRASPAYWWGPVRVAKTVITRQLRQRYPRFESIGPITGLEVSERAPSGRPVRLSIIDQEGSVIDLEAENFRLAVDPTGREIKSTFFTPVVETESILFTQGRGFGHGIGMCQYGANELARRGMKAGKILSYYYPTSRLSRAY